MPAPRTGRHRSMITLLILAVLLPMIITAPRAAAEPPTLNPPEDVVAAIKPGHPRLMVDAAGLARIEQQVASSELAAGLKQQLITEANRMLTLPVSVYEFPDGRTLLLVTREVQRRSVFLSLAYRLTGDERYAARAYQEFAAVAQFPDWNPVSWLSVAELLYAYAVGYDWLHDYLSADQRAVMRTAMIEFGLNEAKIAYDSSVSWTRTTSNWNIVCNGGVIMAALAIGDETPALANELLHRAYDSLPVALAEYGPDGGYPEGTTYWGYATRFLASTLSSLETAIGDDYGISDAPGLDTTVDFSLQLTGSSGQAFNYADASTGTPGGPPATYWLAQRYQQPAYAWWADQGADRASANALPPLHLMWLGMIESEDPGAGGLPLDKAFERAHVETMRSGWDPSATYVGFRPGDNAANHGDLDMGTFVLDALGVRWAMELGTDSYSLPGYFDTKPDGQRWTYYRKRAEGQNTLVLNPGAAADQSTVASGTTIRRAGNAAAAFSIADLSEAYSDRGVTSWQRGIAEIDGRSRVVVQDEVSGPAPITPYWFMHTSAAITVAADGTTANLTLNGKQLQARLLDGPAGAKFSIMDAKPLPTSPNPSGQNPNTNLRKLVVTADPASAFRLSVLLEPLPTGEPADPPAVTDLADWSLPTVGAPRLTSLSVDGEPVAGFGPSSLTYTIDRAAGGTVPVITATAPDGVPITVRQATAIPGSAEVCLGQGDDPCAVRYAIRVQDAFSDRVIASAAGVNPPGNALDHDLETLWTAEGEQWIQVNLGEPTTVSGVSLAWSQGTARKYDFAVQTSLDGETWTEALPRTSSSGTTLELEDHPFEAVQARYVRLQGYGNNLNAWNSLAELRVATADGSWPGPPEVGRELVGLELSDDDLELAVGGETRIKGTAVYADGSRVPLRLGEITLSSTDPAVVAVTRDERIVGRSAGTATIAARFREHGRLVFASALARVG
ncbi:discoidin domain-containing protein [Microlunatus sp. GCM10028923]|uniref:discoidin domain-containing protein n=1 Tax=Microlunatus sp. GCM10028923 TaxID=3273400 RepID=UPI00361BC516